MGSLTLNDWLFLSVIFLMWTTFPPQNKPKLLYVWSWFSNKRLGTCPCVFSCTGNQSIFNFLLSKKSAKYVKGCLCNWGFSYVSLSNNKYLGIISIYQNYTNKQKSSSLPSTAIRESNFDRNKLLAVMDFLHIFLTSRFRQLFII